MSRYVSNDDRTSPAAVIEKFNVNQSPASRAGNTGGTDGTKGEKPSFDPYAVQGFDRPGPLPKVSDK